MNVEGQWLAMHCRWKALGRGGLEPNSEVPGIRVGTLSRRYLRSFLPIAHICVFKPQISVQFNDVHSDFQNPREIAVAASVMSINFVEYLRSLLCLP